MEISQFKDKSSKHSKPSQDCTCDLCSKVMSRRGLFNHLRLKHQMSNDEARETTRRILQNNPYAYSGVTRLFTVSVDNEGNFKITNKVDTEEKLMDLIYVIEKQFNVKFFFGGVMKLSNGGSISNKDFSKNYANKYEK